MANIVRYFYYAPTWDYPPGGPIKLGNVLMSIRMPEAPLYTAPLPSDSEVVSTSKTKVIFSAEKLREGKFSILTKFLSVVGFGADVGVSWKQSDEEAYTFERIETTQFVPKPEYVERCVDAAPVRRYLEKSRYRKPVYIITGLKTVYGAKARSFASRGYGGQLDIDVDGTVWSGGAVPVGGGGPGLEATTEKRTGVSWEGSDDYVLAFRVRRIRVAKAEGGAPASEDYRKGAMLGIEREMRLDGSPSLRIVADEDPEPEDGCAKEALAEGDAVVICRTL